jgi:hypothetical protein
MQNIYRSFLHPKSPTILIPFLKEQMLIKQINADKGNKVSNNQSFLHPKSPTIINCFFERTNADKANRKNENNI